LASGLSVGALLLSLAGDDAVLGEWVDELIAIATEQGFLFWGPWGSIYRGWVKLKNGDAPEGIDLLRSGLAAYHTAAAELWMPYFIALLARACEITELGPTR
jgi:hypothetical protein